MPTPPLMDDEFRRVYGIFEQLQKMLLQKRLEVLGFAVTGNEWQTKVATRPLYQRWFDESARILSALDVELRQSGQTGESEEQLWTRWREYKAAEFRTAGLSSVVELVEETLVALPEILTGKTPATDVLFPNSSMERVENIYKNNIQSDYFNEVVAQTVLAAAQSRSTVRRAPICSFTASKQSRMFASFGPVPAFQS